jgi:hypothetical protein
MASPAVLIYVQATRERLSPGFIAYWMQYRFNNHKAYTTGF